MSGATTRIQSQSADKHARASFLRAAGAGNLAFLGFSLYWAWMHVCFRGPRLFILEHQAPHQWFLESPLPLLCSLVATAIAHPIWGIILWRVPALQGRVPWIQATITGVGSLAAFITLETSSGPSAQIIVLALAAIVGITSAAVDMAWAQVFGRLRPELAGRYICLSAALGVGLYFVLMPLGTALPLARALIALALPILSAWCLMSSHDRIGREQRSTGNHQQDEADIPERSVLRTLGILWRPVAGSLALFFMYDCISMLIGQTEYGVAHGFGLALQIVAALAMALVSRGGRRISIGGSYGMAFALLCAGFMLLPITVQLANPSYALLGASALSWAGGSVFDLMILCMVAHSAYDYRMSGAVVSGMVRGLTVGASALGAATGWLLGDALWASPLQMTVFSQVVLFFSIASAALFLGRRRLAVLPSQGNAEPQFCEALAPNPSVTGPRHAGGAITGEDPNEVAKTAVIVEAGAAPEALDKAEPTPEELAQQLEEYRAQCIARVAERGGLSKREVQVLDLVTQGRSVPYIAEQLVISENTVHSHVKRVYRKLGVKSKQELIDIVERTSRELALGQQ